LFIENLRLKDILQDKEDVIIYFGLAVEPLRVLLGMLSTCQPDDGKIEAVLVSYLFLISDSAHVRLYLVALLVLLLRTGKPRLLMT